MSVLPVQTSVTCPRCEYPVRVYEMPSDVVIDPEEQIIGFVLRPVLPHRCSTPKRSLGRKSK